MFTSADSCVIFDEWVNVNTPTPMNTGDMETIKDAMDLALNCLNPIKVDCRTATGTPYNQTGQVTTCNMVDGFICKNTDQTDTNGCLDYKIRLGCLKNSPECSALCVFLFVSNSVKDYKHLTTSLLKKQIIVV